MARFKGKHTTGRVCDLLLDAAYALSQEKALEILTRIKELDEDAYNYIAEIGADRWIQSFKQIPGGTDVTNNAGGKLALLKR